MITNFKNNKENSLINYLFSHVNADIGFTKEQSAHLKEDIKQNSIITFVTSDFSNYDGNDNLVGKTIKCFKNINIEFKNYYVIDNRIDRSNIKEIINNSDIIYLLGGNPRQQMKNIEQYNLITSLKNFKGLIIGVSAGAMNQAKKVKYLDENNKLVEYDGIGLAEPLIYPHLNIDSLDNLKEILNVSKYIKIYCLPNESFIKIKNNKMIIEGLYYVLGE